MAIMAMHCYRISRLLQYVIMMSPITLLSRVVFCIVLSRLMRVIHLGLFAGSRMRQTEALIEAVSASAPSDAPLLIAGDFNDWTNSLSESLCEQLGVTEVFDRHLTASRFGSYLRRLSGRGPRKAPARTFPAAMPVLQLDRIYVRGFDVVDAKVLFGASWARLSDHAPIMTELILQPASHLISPDVPNEMTHESG
jgi:endonuclease/exonuclease/phosphatase family metal-dependent hydrolase